MKELNFLTAGLVLASFHAGTALSAPDSTIHYPDSTIHYNVKYGVTDQETADRYLLNKGVNPDPWQFLEAGDKSNYADPDAEIVAMAEVARGLLDRLSFSPSS